MNIPLVVKYIDDAKMAMPHYLKMEIQHVLLQHFLLNSSLEGVSRTTIFKLFANVPILNGIHCFCVSDGANPITDSLYPNNIGWWNVICFGIGGGAYRMVQITSQVYKTEFGFEASMMIGVSGQSSNCKYICANLLHFYLLPDYNVQNISSVLLLRIL